MPPRRLPDDPLEWLSRARSDLALARNRGEGVYLEDLCFHAQQAAEKAVKALLIRRGALFPYVHDLATLLTVLENAGAKIPPDIREAERLTRFAVLARYPGPVPPVDGTEHAEALNLAEAVVRWAAAELGEVSEA